MSDWYVYLLECADGSVYTGITTDLERRMQMHKDGDGSKYVASKGYKELLFAIAAEDKSTASRIEYNVKQLSHHEKRAFFREHERRVA